MRLPLGGAMGLHVAGRPDRWGRPRAVALAVMGLLAAASLILFGATAGYAETGETTKDVVLADLQLHPEVQAVTDGTPVSPPTGLARSGVDVPPAALAITGVLLFVAGGGLLLVRRKLSNE